MAGFYWAIETGGLNRPLATLCHRQNLQNDSPPRQGQRQDVARVDEGAGLVHLSRIDADMAFADKLGAGLARPLKPREPYPFIEPDRFMRRRGLYR